MLPGDLRNTGLASESPHCPYLHLFISLGLFIRHSQSSSGFPIAHVFQVTGFFFNLLNFGSFLDSVFLWNYVCLD